MKTRPTGSAWNRVAIIILTAALIILLGAATRIISNIDIAYTDLLYLVLVPAAYWYKRHAAYPGMVIAAMHIVAVYIITGHVGIDTLTRAAMLVIIPYILGYFFEVVDLRNRDRSFATTCNPDTGRLISQLSSRNPDTRYQAAECLGDAKDPAAVGQLATLLDDPESGVRWKAAEALGKMGSPAIKPLIDGLKSSDVDVRWMSAVALGDTADPSTISALLGALDDEDAYVRSRAALALAAIGNDAEGSLVTSLSTGNERTRKGAALALGRIGSKDATLSLIKSLNNSNEDVRLQVRSALADIGKEAIPALTSALSTEKDPHTRAGAALTLGKIGGPEAENSLIKAQDDEDEYVQRIAREALNGIRRHNLGEDTPELHDR